MDWCWPRQMSQNITKRRSNNVYIVSISVKRFHTLFPHGGVYSETTWAVGIAQLTHHEVQGGGKNPSTSGLGIFAPTADRGPPMSICFYPTLYLGNHLYFFKPDSSWKQQNNTIISEIDSVHSTKRVVMVTPRHLLDVIMLPVVTRAPNITNISCLKIAPKPLVYIDPTILFELLYIYTR